MDATFTGCRVRGTYGTRIINTLLSTSFFCVGDDAISIELFPDGRYRLQQVILHEMFAEFQPISGESVGIEALRDDEQ